MVFALAKLVAENVDSQTSQGFELSVPENFSYLANRSYMKILIVERTSSRNIIFLPIVELYVLVLIQISSFLSFLDLLSKTLLCAIFCENQD